MQRKVPISFLVLSFLVLTICPPDGYAQSLGLPRPGTPIETSPEYVPTILRGLKVLPNNPFLFDFIVDTGDGPSSLAQVEQETLTLIRYFLTSLTVPEEEMWVNLSPHESDRIVAPAFGVTAMGRDLLAQDYLLKQVTATLLHPDKEIGKTFWKNVRQKSLERFGTTEIPVKTFNKVWIVPDEAEVYENSKTRSVFVTKSTLNVLLEEDYFALEKGRAEQDTSSSVRKVTPEEKQANDLGTQIVREIILPELKHEVNHGRNFARIRQVYHSLILATWYKKKIKDSILQKAYIDHNKTAGVDVEDKEVKHKIYQRYLEAFKQGVCSMIREEVDPGTQQLIPRKYFSGGWTPERLAVNLKTTDDPDAVDKSMMTREEKMFLFRGGGKAVIAQALQESLVFKSPEDELAYFVMKTFDNLPEQEIAFRTSKMSEPFSVTARVAISSSFSDLLGGKRAMAFESPDGGLVIVMDAPIRVGEGKKENTLIKEAIYEAVQKVNWEQTFKGTPMEDLYAKAGILARAEAIKAFHTNLPDGLWGLTPGDRNELNRIGQMSAEDAVKALRALYDPLMMRELAAVQKHLSAEDLVNYLQYAFYRQVVIQRMLTNKLQGKKDVRSPDWFALSVRRYLRNYLEQVPNESRPVYSDLVQTLFEGGRNEDKIRRVLEAAWPEDPLMEGDKENLLAALLPGRTGTMPGSWQKTKDAMANSLVRFAGWLGTDQGETVLVLTMYAVAGIVIVNHTFEDLNIFNDGDQQVTLTREEIVENNPLDNTSTIIPDGQETFLEEPSYSLSGERGEIILVQEESSLVTEPSVDQIQEGEVIVETQADEDVRQPDVTHENAKFESLMEQLNSENPVTRQSAIVGLRAFVPEDAVISVLPFAQRRQAFRIQQALMDLFPGESVPNVLFAAVNSLRQMYEAGLTDLGAVDTEVLSPFQSQLWSGVAGETIARADTVVVSLESFINRGDSYQDAQEAQQLLRRVEGYGLENFLVDRLYQYGNRGWADSLLLDYHRDNVTALQAAARSTNLPGGAQELLRKYLYQGMNYLGEFGGGQQEINDAIKSIISMLRHQVRFRLMTDFTDWHSSPFRLFVNSLMNTGSIENFIRAAGLSDREMELDFPIFIANLARFDKLASLTTPAQYPALRLSERFAQSIADALLFYLASGTDASARLFDHIQLNVGRILADPTNQVKPFLEEGLIAGLDREPGKIRDTIVLLIALNHENFSGERRAAADSVARQVQDLIDQVLAKQRVYDPQEVVLPQKDTVVGLHYSNTTKDKYWASETIRTLTGQKTLDPKNDPVNWNKGGQAMFKANGIVYLAYVGTPRNLTKYPDLKVSRMEAGKERRMMNYYGNGANANLFLGCYGTEKIGRLQADYGGDWYLGNPNTGVGVYNDLLVKHLPQILKRAKDAGEVRPWTDIKKELKTLVTADLDAMQKNDPDKFAYIERYYLDPYNEIDNLTFPGELPVDTEKILLRLGTQDIQLAAADRAIMTDSEPRVAVTAQKKNVGGIDLDNINLQINADAAGFELFSDAEQLLLLENASGLSPVIYGVQPLSMPMLHLSLEGARPLP